MAELCLTPSFIPHTFSHINHPNFGKCGSGYEGIEPPDSKDDGGFCVFMLLVVCRRNLDALMQAQ